MNRRRKIAIVLFVIQILGYIGCRLTDAFSKMELLEYLGFFMPAIIGAIIWDDEEGWSD